MRKIDVCQGRNYPQLQPKLSTLCTYNYMYLYGVLVYVYIILLKLCRGKKQNHYTY